jgi:hypothetical protein
MGIANNGLKNLRPHWTLSPILMKNCVTNVGWAVCTGGAYRAAMGASKCRAA